MGRVLGPPTKMVRIDAGGPASSHRAQPRDELAVERAHLVAGELRAEAEVHAEAERKVLVGVGAGDIEAMRVVEDAAGRGSPRGTTGRRGRPG